MSTTNTRPTLLAATIYARRAAQGERETSEPELPSTRDASGKLSTDGIYARRAVATKSAKSEGQPAHGSTTTDIFVRRSRA